MDVKDTTDRLAWGWLAVLHNITEMRWIHPTEAARCSGIPSWKLRYWSDQGGISCSHQGRGHHRRYLAAELDVVRRITGNYPTLLALKWHIAVAISIGFSTESRRK
jgi:hypothetical protein